MPWFQPNIFITNSSGPEAGIFQGNPVNAIVTDEFLAYQVISCHGINPLAPGGFEWNFTRVILILILVIGGWVISCEFAVRWMLLDIIDDKSTLVQVMAWCRQATSHYLSQCWPRSLTPYAITRPQWVNWFCNWTLSFMKKDFNSSLPGQNGRHLQTVFQMHLREWKVLYVD